MITISNRTADFNELSIENLTKRPLFDALKIFWKNSEMDYMNFLETNGINFFKEYSRIDELRDSVNNELDTLKNVAKSNQNFAFDFKIADSIKKLGAIKDHEFSKFTIDFRTIGDQNLKEQIKDIFLTTKSVSLIDFMEVTEDTCSLIYSKKGAFYYENEPYLATAREQVSMLENYKVPKDNNFIVARFIQDLAFRFKENCIDESFVLNYADNQGKNVKSVDEVLEYANLSRDEKQALKEQEQIQTKAQEIAKAEIKAENNATRKSLNQAQAKEKLNEPQAQLYSISNIENLAKFNATADTQTDEKDSISEIVARNIEIYRQKEIEKTKERLERAEKDAQKAYYDLKEYLSNGASINEALKNISQKYRNDDTINFASLLFSQDILNLFSKDNQIKELNQNKVELEKELESTYEELSKKDETISKIKGTLQTKINEMSNFKYQVEQEFEKKLKEQESVFNAELDKVRAEQKEIVNSYENEVAELDGENERLGNENKKLRENIYKLDLQNQNLTAEIERVRIEYNEVVGNYEIEFDKLKSENEKLKESRFELTSQNNSLQSEVKELSNKVNKLEKENSQNAQSSIEFLKLQMQNENLANKEQDYKDRIANLEIKNNALEDRIHNILSDFMKQSQTATQPPKKELRSKDILGETTPKKEHKE